MDNLITYNSYNIIPQFIILHFVPNLKNTQCLHKLMMTHFENVPYIFAMNCILNNLF
jgi:hypothetical protein